MVSEEKGFELDACSSFASLSGAPDHSGTTGFNKSGHTSQGGDKVLRKKIIHKEDTHVRKARFAVGAAIFACALAVSVAIYILANKSDYRSFELKVCSQPS